MRPELRDATAHHRAPAASAPAAAAPVKGRPRSEAVSQSILEAVLDLIAEHGTVTDVSVEGVAELSGVSKATIYRRWSSKEELIAAAFESIKAPVPEGIPHTSLHDDLVFLGNNMRRVYGPRDMKVIRCMMTVFHEDPEYKRHHDRLVERRRKHVRDTFEYWLERGEVAPDLDLDLAVAMFTSPLLTIFVYGQYPHLQADDTVERFVGNLLRGLGGPLCESR
jgi:AcrR family transcriptional regulator